MSVARVVTAVSPAREGWEVDGLCRQVGGDLWFPEHGESSREAKRLCRRCPVQAECLEAALARDERFGVWGGLSHPERLALKRRREVA